MRLAGGVAGGHGAGSHAATAAWAVAARSLMRAIAAMAAVCVASNGSSNGMGLRRAVMAVGVFVGVGRVAHIKQAGTFNACTHHGGWCHRFITTIDSVL